MTTSAESPKRTILVVGAGASFGARTNLAGQVGSPPLGDELAKYLLGWLEENDPARLDHVQRVLADYELDETYPYTGLWELDHIEELKALLAEIARDGGFEGTLNRLLDQQASWGLLSDLNLVIASAFLGGVGCPFDPREDRYDQLINLPGREISAIISPNYDLLLEEALERSNRLFAYRGIGAEEPTSAIPIFKIHGSVNWMQVKGHASSASLEIALKNVKPTRFVDQDGAGISVETVILYVPQGRRNLLLELKHRPVKPIVLATYGRGKPSTHERVRLENVRRLAQEFVAANADADVVMIGLRPPEDDVDDPTWAALCRALGQSRGSKTYLSPVEGECAAMGKFGFTSRRATLESYLAAP